MSEVASEKRTGCLDVLAVGALAFFALKALIGAAPTVHVREETAELTAQLDEQVASGELAGQELYEETFIVPHTARDKGHGVAGWLATDDVRDLYPAGARPCLALSHYNSIAGGAEVTEDGNIVTVDPANDEPTIRIVMSDELFGEFQPGDEVTAERLRGYQCPDPSEDL